MDANGRPILLSGDLKVALGYLGSATLFVGLFLPAVELPDGGNANYLWNGWGPALALLLLALGSALALLLRRQWALWLTGSAALPLIAGGIARALGEVEASRLSIGWPILILGAMLVLVSAELARREGTVMPPRFADAAVAVLLVLVLLVVGPQLLTGTRKAVTEFEVAKKQEERGDWQPHDYAREVMKATREHVKAEESLAEQWLEEERAAAALEAERRELERRASRVRRVADVRRWYPRFSAGLEPVFDARRGFLADYEAGGLASAQSACASVEESVRAVRASLPASPDRAMDRQADRLFDLYLASAAVCRGDAQSERALAELERTEEQIGVVLDELTGTLRSYCLRLPTGDAGSTDPAAMLTCAPRDRLASAP